MERETEMQNLLSSFEENLTVAIIGATGGIGQAFIQHLSTQENVTDIHAFSRTKPNDFLEKVKWQELDITNEASISKAIENINDIKFDIVINATGILSVGKKSPERSLKDIDFKNFEEVFAINTHGPTLVMKYFLPLLKRERKSVYANLSARVGSISDNQLGGWYAYRASKAALNMVIKTASIEVARRNKTAAIVGLHPGTVKTKLSEPFQSNVPDGKLFTPEHSTESMLKVINNLQATDTGKCFDFAGKAIDP